jgi:hypothetical protein
MPRAQRQPQGASAGKRSERRDKRDKTMQESRYEYSVFVNCPFDAEYRPLFHAIVFAIHDCGFAARSALGGLTEVH